MIFPEKGLRNGSTPIPLADNLEITASYWEARIKTYGFHRLTDVRLFGVDAGSRDLSRLGHALRDMGEEGIPLVLTFAQGSLQGLSVRFVVPSVFEGRVQDRLKGVFGTKGEGWAQALPVEVIYFYGPHFGDRFGIAEAALRSLAGSGIQAMGAACSGSCVYLVLPEGRSEEAVGALSKTFHIPKAPARKEHEEDRV